MVIYNRIHGMMAASAAPSSTRTPISWLKSLTKAVPIVNADQARHEAVIRNFGVRILSMMFQKGSKTTYVAYTTETAAPYLLPVRWRSLLKPVRLAFPMLLRSKYILLALCRRGRGKC